MILPTEGRPGDQRPFIHKRLLKVVSKVTGFIPTPVSQVVSGIAGRFAGGGGGPVPSRALVPRTQTARVTQFSEANKRLGREAKFGLKGDDDCVIPGMKRDPSTGKCAFFFGERRGPNGGREVGEAVMGQYGAALEPGIMTIDRAVCLRGMQLGNDGLCYNKAQISNKQRMWPAGRKPLLSGGDMRAIQIATRAGKRLEGATKRLQRLGMMKKPTRGRAPPGRGSGVVVKEAGAGSVTIQ